MGQGSNPPSVHSTGCLPARGHLWKRGTCLLFTGSQPSWRRGEIARLHIPAPKSTSELPFTPPSGPLNWWPSTGYIFKNSFPYKSLKQCVDSHTPVMINEVLSSSSSPWSHIFIFNVFWSTAIFIFWCSDCPSLGQWKRLHADLPGVNTNFSSCEQICRFLIKTTAPYLSVSSWNTQHGAHCRNSKPSINMYSLTDLLLQIAWSLRFSY